MVPNRNGAVTSAVLVHLRVEPAHFDWRSRERPALALLAWEALARDPLARLRRIQVESTGTKLILGQRLSPIATSAASALLIALRRACVACLCGASCTRKPPVGLGYRVILRMMTARATAWISQMRKRASSSKEARGR